MTEIDDMLLGVASDGRSALDRYIERAERDDSVKRLVERIRARNQEIRRIYGLPERVYAPIEAIRDARAAP